MNRKGVSPVIATVLLIAITVVMIGIIAAFVVPFVTNYTRESGDCFRVLNKVKLVQTDYSCFVPGQNASTGFSVQVDNVEIAGFRALLYAQGTSEPIDVYTGPGSPNIRMLGTPFGSELRVPGKGALRTYIVNGAYTQIEIVPILESGTCEKSAPLKLVPCSDTEIIGNLTQTEF